MRILFTKGVLYGVCFQCAPDRKSVCSGNQSKQFLSVMSMLGVADQTLKSLKAKTLQYVKFDGVNDLSDERRMATMPLIRLERTGKLQKQRGKLIFVLLIIIY